MGNTRRSNNLGTQVNSKGPEVQPAISPDGTILVFAALGRDDERIGIHKEYAHGDLYVSVQTGGVWSVARTVGPQ